MLSFYSQDSLLLHLFTLPPLLFSLLCLIVSLFQHPNKLRTPWQLKYPLGDVMPSMKFHLLVEDASFALGKFLILDLSKSLHGLSYHFTSVMVSLFYKVPRWVAWDTFWTLLLIHLVFFLFLSLFIFIRILLIRDDHVFGTASFPRWFGFVRTWHKVFRCF